MPFKNGAHYAGLILATLALLVGVYSFRSIPPREYMQAIPLPKIDDWPHDLAWSRDGKTLAVANKGSLELWDVRMGKTPPRVDRPPDAGPSGDLAYSKSGRFLAVAYAYSITVWTTSEWKKIAHIKYDGPREFMTFADDDATLVVVFSRDSADAPGLLGMHTLVCRWKVASGERLSTVDFGTKSTFKALSASGRHGVVDTWEGEGVYDLTTREEVLMNRPIRYLGSSIFSEDGSALITYEHGRIWILAVPSGVEIKHLDVVIGKNRGDDSHLSLSADGRLLAVGGGFPDSHLAGLISLKTGRVLETIECGPDESICELILLSPDGRSLATMTGAVGRRDQPMDSVLRLWKIPTSW